MIFSLPPAGALNNGAGLRAMGFRAGGWGDGSAEGFVDRTSDRAGYEPDQPGGSWSTAAERWIGIGKFINKTSKKMQTFLNKFWKVREQAGKFSMKAHVSLISHIKNEGISDLLVACFLEG